MFIQSMTIKPIRDFIFPIVNIVDKHFILKGTAFFVGDEGFAVTASHVVDQLLHDEDGNAYNPLEIVGLFIDSFGQWTPIDVLSHEKHPEHDVSLLRFQAPFKTILKIKASWHNAPEDYALWGYPESVAHEVRALANNSEEAAYLINPDLVFSRGYIRRRISHNLHSSIYKGNKFYELSAVAGSCCSGSPIISWPPTSKNPLRVIGVYVGENNVGQPPVGYAVRCDAISSWTPEMTGKPLHLLSAET